MPRGVFGGIFHYGTVGFVLLFTVSMPATVFFCLRNSACALLCLFPGVHFWGYGEMEQAHLVSLSHTLPASMGHWHPKRTTYPMDDCWELVAGRSTRCAEPVEKSRSVAKEFCCLLSLLFSDRLLPEGSGSHTL